jgi:hypothetical protein
LIRRLLTVVAVLLPGAVLPADAGAQLPGIFPPGSPWIDPFYPKLFWTPREGLTGGLFYSVALQPEYADDTPAPFRARFALDVQASTSGSRFAELDAWLPALADGWRFHTTLAAEHWRREPYFGLGNATRTDDPAAEGVKRYFQAFHVRNYFRGDVQRRIAGGLRVMVGWHAEHWLLDSLETPSRLAADLAAGAGPRLGVPTDEVSLRGGIVFDTRDREANPLNGLLLELIHSRADGDVAGDLTYTRTTASARGWLALSEKWGLAGRVAGETMGGTPGVGSYFTIEGSDRRVEALGGPESHRGVYRFRYLDADKLFGNFEVRYAIYPYLLRPVVVAFVDVGRVFPAGGLELTADDLKVGGGLGLYIQFISENAILGGTIGYGPEGVAVQGAWKWAF